MDTPKVVLIIVFAAAVGEGINEFFFLPWFDLLKTSEEDKSKNRWREIVRVQVMRLWSGLIGILIALGLNICVFSLLGAEFRPLVAGTILTGLLIGRGSNWVHELLKKFVGQDPKGIVVDELLLP